jgi:WhiB family transcriptional regulator, redox-sensing transcriptional regulator
VTDIGESSPSDPDRPDRSDAMPAGSGTAHADVAFRGWMSRGACLGADPELFFPAADKGPARHQISAAKRVCQHCTVRALCLTYAVATRQSGIWGGTTLEERFAMQGPARWRDGQASRPAWAPVAAEERRAGSARHRN